MKTTISAFASPNGLEPGFKGEVKKMVRESDLICAFTMLKGLNSSRTDKAEPMRFTLPNEFNSNLVGVLSGLSAFKNRLGNSYR